MTTHRLSQRIDDVLRLQPDAPALEYDRQWLSWRQLRELAEQISAVIGTHRPQVGILLRNRPAHVAALLGVLRCGATVVVINPGRGDERIKADVDQLALPLIIGEPADLALLGEPPATTVVSISGVAEPKVTAASQARTYHERPGVAVRMLTSGTTGPPKRVDLTYDMLAHSVMGPGADKSTPPTELRRGVAIVNSPLVHIGGVFRILQCVAEARPFVLLERFELDRWAEAVRAHRPRAVSLVPTALRMVLHSDLPREDLASIRAVTSGTAPLSPDDSDAFTEKYGIPVLTSYAATEFGGGVASWTLADHQKYWRAKRGSVGRANPGAQLRVVSDDGSMLGPDQVGLLEVKPAQLGPSADWMRTTDMARIDADGFLWIVGRADQAIIRGGFKVMPDDVRRALESHPAVAGAAVVGRNDERLGETPVAMVELREPGSVDAAELIDYLRTRLARYEIPTEIAIVAELPRTPSGKPDLGAIRRHFSDALFAARDRPCRVNRPPSADVLRIQARSRGDHPLLICDSERISYADADRLSGLLARGLIGLGAGKGTHVGLLYPNGVAFVVGMLAAARIGAVVIPFSTFVTARELREQLVDSDTEILLAAASFRSHDYVQRLDRGIAGVPLSTPTIGCSTSPHRNCATSSSTSPKVHRLADTVDERCCRRWKTTSTALIR